MLFKDKVTCDVLAIEREIIQAFLSSQTEVGKAKWDVDSQIWAGWNADHSVQYIFCFDSKGFILLVNRSPIAK